MMTTRQIVHDQLQELGYKEFAQFALASKSERCAMFDRLLASRKLKVDAAKNLTKQSLYCFALTAGLAILSGVTIAASLSGSSLITLVAIGAAVAGSFFRHKAHQELTFLDTSDPDYALKVCLIDTTSKSEAKLNLTVKEEEYFEDLLKYALEIKLIADYFKTLHDEGIEICPVDIQIANLLFTHSKQSPDLLLTTSSDKLYSNLTESHVTSSELLSPVEHVEPSEKDPALMLQSPSKSFKHFIENHKI